MQHPVFIIIGTRPEAIKLAPVYFALKRKNIPTKVIATSQHRELLAEMLSLFGIDANYDLDIMRDGQDVFYVTQAVLAGMQKLFATENPSLVVVQGDTTTTFAAGLAAFYSKIPVLHVEAGLRTHNIFAPFPEEFNRRAVSLFAQYHCAPTVMAAQALVRSSIADEAIFMTGNTVVDALDWIRAKIEQDAVAVSPKIRDIVNRSQQQKRKLILLTAHRRESFNGGIERVLCAVRSVVNTHQDLQVIYPAHPNPHVQKAIQRSGIGKDSGVTMVPPVKYTDLIYLLMNAHCVITDSGGIQEEAVSLGKQVLVTREESERMEGVHAGLAHLVGTDEERIRIVAERVLSQASAEVKPAQVYGDGTAGEQIATIIEERFYAKSMRSRTGIHRSANSAHSNESWL